MGDEYSSDGSEKGKKISFVHKKNDGSVDGRVTLRPDKKRGGDTGWLQGLHVNEESRGKGIGGRLVDNALQQSQFEEVRTEIDLSNSVSFIMHFLRGFRVETVKEGQDGKKYGVMVLRRKK